MQRVAIQRHFPSRIVFLASVVLLVLAASGCGTDAEGTGSVAQNTVMPTPQLEITPENPLWAASACGNDDEVTEIVTRFIDAFNDGDLESLDALFPNESANLQLSTVPSMTTNMDQFQAYSVIGAGQADFLAHSKDAALGYLADRHEQRERLQLAIVEVFPFSSGGGVLFQSTRAADDLPERMAFGRVWVNCDHEWVVALAMGDASS